MGILVAGGIPINKAEQRAIGTHLIHNQDIGSIPIFAIWLKVAIGIGEMLL